MVCYIEWKHIISSSMGLTHGGSLYPSFRSMGLCVGWDRYRNLLIFYLISIYALEHISYLMISSLGVRNIPAVIYSFDYIV